MSDSNSDSNKDAWIARVLGVVVPRSAAAMATALRPAIAAWQEASETVDQQISALQAALRRSDDAELQEIAEFGLNGVTGNFRVPLMAALRDAQAANPRALVAVPRIAAAFRQHLDSDKRVAVCDENPFGVAVSIRDTLGAALDGLTKTLSVAA